MVLIIGVVGQICSGKSEFCNLMTKDYQFKSTTQISEQETENILNNLELYFESKKLQFSEIEPKQFKQLLKKKGIIEKLMGKAPIMDNNNINNNNSNENNFQSQLNELNTQQQLQQLQISSPIKKSGEYSEINSTNIQNKMYPINQNVKQCAKTLESWSKNQCIKPICYEKELEIMHGRNFFHLVCINAPLHDRWERFQVKYADFVKKNNFGLEHFILLDDIITHESDIYTLSQRANYTICNKSNLKRLKDLIDIEIHLVKRTYRPCWDQYFISIAYVLKARSNCMKDSVGALLVKENRIISTGYNGTPQGIQNCFDFGCEDCNTNFSDQPQLDKCICLHAEESTILEAGIAISSDSTLYSTQFPCIWCSKCIIQAKIKKLVYHTKVHNQNEAEELLKTHLVIIQQAEYDETVFLKQ